MAVCDFCGHSIKDHDYTRLLESRGPWCMACKIFCRENLSSTNEDIGEKDNDPVNHPNHYTSGSIEVWDFIVDKDLDFLRGNIIKYVSRAGKKDPEHEKQDLEKAMAYLKKALEAVDEV